MKKFFAILLAVIMALGLIGCNPPAAPSGTEPPDYNHTVEDDGGHKEEPDDGKGEDTGGTGPNTDTELPDADLLAFSFDRLENVDLSFNFTINETAGANGNNNGASGFAASVGTSSRASGVLYDDKGDYQPYEPQEGETYFGNPDTLLPHVEDFFSSNEGSLSLAHDNANRIREDVLERVNVMNTFVHFGTFHYLLNYIPETDTLHVYSVESVTNGSETYDILVYPDADGDETVEYWSVYTDERYDTNMVEHLIYSAGKRYYVENTMCYHDQNASGKIVYDGRITELYRKGDEWLGYKMPISTETPFFSHSGNYAYGAGLNIEFYKQSNDGTLLQPTCYVVAYDGDTGDQKEEAENVYYSDNDVFRLVDGNFLISEFNKMIDGLFFADAKELDGWSKVELVYGQDGYKLHTIRFDNGKTLAPNSLWKKGYGIIKYTEEFDNEDYRVIGEDERGEVQYFADWDEFVADTVRIDTTTVHSPHEPIHQVGFDFNACPADGDDNKKMELIKECWEYLGLTVHPVCGAPQDLFGAFAETDPQKIAEEIMLDVYNDEVGLDGIRQVCIQAKDNCDDTIVRLHSLFDEFDIIESEDMPVRPASFGLVQLGGKLNGQATVSQDGIDYTAVTFNAAKTVIFTKESRYALYVAWGSLAERITEPVAYAGEAFTLTGNKLPLPDLPVGTHSAMIFLGKVLDGGCARISDAISVPVSAFEKVTAVGPEEKGLIKKADFTCEDGLKAEVSLEDVEAPEIFVNGEEAADTPYQLTFETEEGKTVSDLFDMITVTDNAVGNMSARSGSFSVEGVVAFASDLLASGTYVYTIIDGGGNTSSVTFQVTVNPPQTENGENAENV